MPLSDDDKREIVLLIREERIKSDEELLEKIEEKFAKYVGETHHEDHEILKELIHYMTRAKTNIFDAVIKSVVTFVILAFAIGFVIMVRR